MDKELAWSVTGIASTNAYEKTSDFRFKDIWFREVMFGFSCVYFPKSRQFVCLLVQTVVRHFANLFVHLWISVWELAREHRGNQFTRHPFTKTTTTTTLEEARLWRINNMKHSTSAQLFADRMIAKRSAPSFFPTKSERMKGRYWSSGMERVKTVQLPGSCDKEANDWWCRAACIVMQFAPMTPCTVPLLFIWIQCTLSVNYYTGWVKNVKAPYPDSTHLIVLFKCVLSC